MARVGGEASGMMELTAESARQAAGISRRSRTSLPPFHRRARAAP